MSVAFLLLLQICIYLEYGEGVFLYRLGGGRFACILGKHHMQLPPLALNAPPEQGGVGGARVMRPHHGPTQSPPPSSGGLLARPRWP